MTNVHRNYKNAVNNSKQLSKAEKSPSSIKFIKSKYTSPTFKIPQNSQLKSSKILSYESKFKEINSSYDQNFNKNSLLTSNKKSQNKISSIMKNNFSETPKNMLSCHSKERKLNYVLKGYCK